MLIFGLLYSHKIAGPIFNLKRVLHKIGNGDLTVTMKLRASDEFHDVEDAFNQMANGLNQRLMTIQKAIAELPRPAQKNQNMFFGQ